MLTTPSTELWLPFEGDANDFSGKGRNGTLQGGAVATGSGRFGRCLSMPGNSGDRVDLGSGLFSPPLTMAAWINPSVVASTEGRSLRIISGNNAANSAGVVSLQVNGTTNQIQFVWGTSDGVMNHITTATVGANAWLHVAASWGGSTSVASSVVLYINGVAQAKSTATSPGGTVLATGLWSIGDSIFFFATFEGLIDDVRIYSRVLLPDEIMVLYAGTGSIRG
jgi:hypothetical protein